MPGQKSEVKFCRKISNLDIISATNVVDADKIYTTLKNKIDLFFHENKDEKFVPLLKIINFLETVTYDYIASINSREERNIFAQVYKYCYENFNKIFTSVKADNFSDFHKFISNHRKRSPVGGAILVNENKEFLCVINKRDEMNFPMGKQDFADEASLKITALRELGEEAGIWLTEEEFEKVDKYVEYRQRCGGKTKLYRLYVVEGFCKDRVDISYTKRGEVTGLAWVQPQQIVDMRNKRKIPKNKLIHNLDRKGAFDVSCFIRKIIPQSRTQCNPFDTFGNEDNCKSEVFKDLCVNK